MQVIRRHAHAHAAADLRWVADRAFSRAAGAPLVGGNHVDVLRDATENYPAWEHAIRAARVSIHVEMYIIHRDHAGRRLIRLLAERAREGVAVRLIYDWFGCGLGPYLGLFRPLINAGGEVRVFNPPSLNAIFGWLRRNHRKLIVVDDEVAFVGGLCVGDMWTGDPERDIAPWRDTGVALRGPAVAHAAQAFAESWRLAGGTPMPPDAAHPPEPPAAGPASLRLVATAPFTAHLFRIDLLIAGLARRTLWIADAYFVGYGPYLNSIRAAAEDGVDVRLLVPQGSDVGGTVALTRSLYRTLLESGVRIFEWNGPMMHAKTAVADSRWARVGSTNLNITGWIGNWELDAVFEDEDVARRLERDYLDDLENSTEIRYDSARQRLLVESPRPRHRHGRTRRRSARAVRTLTVVGRSLGAAMSGTRRLEEFEYPPLLIFGALLVTLAIVTYWQPRVLVWPVVILAAWTGIGLIIEAIGLWWKSR
jgi:phosphatidylserine/phosphatidylglycerophosphate/cardiolipin synthase-like enzyme